MTRSVGGRHLWKCVAFLASRRPVARFLIRRSQRTPYKHLPHYMSRWWLFNAYPFGQHGDKHYPRLPSIRIHHILREDLAAHMHDHPWDARTIILDGWYVERRQGAAARVLRRGDTASINFGEYHHIERVSDGGVWTLFITFRYGGKWGFNVGGTKVSPQEYVKHFPERDLPAASESEVSHGL